MIDPDSTAPNAAVEHTRAITHLYRLFAHRRQGARPWADIDLPPERADLPERGDVRSLSDADYRHLAWHGFCFDGDHPRTVKYFLPRLFEDWANPPFDLEMVVSYMNRCRWRTWPKEEVAAIDRFLCTRLSLDLAAEPHWSYAHPVTRTFKLATFAGTEIGELFGVWASDTSIRARIHLARFITELFGYDQQYSVLRTQWDDLWAGDGVTAEAMDRIFRDLVSPCVRESLEAAFFSAGSDAHRKQLSDAVLYLELLTRILEQP
jgi:hypothetical protein